MPFDPDLDLTISVDIPHPPALVWRALTEPELVKEWFTPAPWRTTECELDLRPGGRFYTRMESPDGEVFPGEACVLEVVPQKRLVWTSVLLPGFRPLPAPTGQTKNPEAPPIFTFTAIIELTPISQGTTYTATTIHSDPQSKTDHESIGFHQGWSAAAHQLTTLLDKLI